MAAVVQHLAVFDAFHDVIGARNCRHGESLPQRLAISDNIRLQTVEFGRTARCNPEPGDGFIQIEQHVMGSAKFLRPFQVAGFRGDHAHVRHGPLHHHAGNLVSMCCQHPFQCVLVIPDADKRVFP